MKNPIYLNELLEWLANSIPEARQEFVRLPDRVDIGTVLNTLFDVTTTYINQREFRVVKRCLVVADDLLHAGEHQISTAMSTIYMYRLAILLYKKDAQSEFIYFLLPPGLRSEFNQHTYPDE